MSKKTCSTRMWFILTHAVLRQKQKVLAVTSPKLRNESSTGSHYSMYTLAAPDFGMILTLSPDSWHFDDRNARQLR